MKVLNYTYINVHGRRQSVWRLYSQPSEVCKEHPNVANGRKDRRTTGKYHVDLGTRLG